MNRPMKSFVSALLLTLLAGAIFFGAWEPGASATGIPASIFYYRDARGSFTLEPPAASAGYLLPLRGTCALPAIMLKVQKKRSGLPARQISYILKNSGAFDFEYIIKDGPGDYDVTIFGKKSVSALNLNGLCVFSIRCNTAVPKNLKGLDISGSILSFVKNAMGKTVGSGECWDLAHEALDASGADWGRPFQFGLQLDPNRDEIRPGDIIQFKSVRIVKELENGGKFFNTIGAPDHTAIILEVAATKRYRIAHQNSDGKRYVITSEVDLNFMKSGKFWIYRPVAGIVD